ncbi:MAG TPA: NAD(P)-dependent oxidoreductase [Stellaceae bacterium]|nr:NAD(P)-dependent oxidoreductase [Stellaceae bacterium]
MLPLSLDLARLRLVLIGTGATCLQRLSLLDEAGARALRVFSAMPSPALAQAAGDRLARHWPRAKDLRGAQLVFIADVPEPEKTALAAAARAGGAILHVEDTPALSDSHAPAVLRRGALAIAISTDGAAPGAAAEIKRFLAVVIGPEWRQRIAHMQSLRQRWRRAGASHDAVRRLTAAHIGRYGWLKPGRFTPAANDCGHKLRHRERGGLS